MAYLWHGKGSLSNTFSVAASSGLCCTAADEYAIAGSHDSTPTALDREGFEKRWMCTEAGLCMALFHS